MDPDLSVSGLEAPGVMNEISGDSNGSCLITKPSSHKSKSKFPSKVEVLTSRPEIVLVMVTSSSTQVRVGSKDPLVRPYLVSTSVVMESLQFGSNEANFKVSFESESWIDDGSVEEGVVNLNFCSGFTVLTPFYCPWVYLFHEAWWNL